MAQRDLLLESAALAQAAPPPPEPPPCCVCGAPHASFEIRPPHPAAAPDGRPLRYCGEHVPATPGVEGRAG